MRRAVSTFLIDQAVGRFAISAREKAKSLVLQRDPRVITISRQLGSGGRRVAEILEKRLGWQIWDSNILHMLASQSRFGLQAEMFEALDEVSQSEVQATMSSFFGSLDKHAYQYLLPKAIMVIARNDCIILGRGAHLFLPQSLSTRITASSSLRVNSLVRRFEFLDEKKALQRIRQSDRQRERFVQELAHQLNRDPHKYDLQISTDRFTVDAVAEIILTAAAERFRM